MTKTNDTPDPPSGSRHYSVWNNTVFMLRLAREAVPSVPVFVAVLAVAAAAHTTAEMFIAPTVLDRIETHAPLDDLLLAIVGFTLLLVLLAAGYDLCETYTSLGRISVRVRLLEKIGLKTASTSYINTLDSSFRAKERKSTQSCVGNYSPSERVWTTYTELLTNVIGFVVYLTVLSGLNGWLIALVLVTAVAGYLSGRRINEWGYRHRDEEQTAFSRFDYLQTVASGREYAKDLRIFGLRPWIVELRAGAIRTLRAFYAHRERMYVWANVIDVVLTFARNGVAYAYLIWLTLAQDLPASRFLLYFTAVGGFATWITGMLDKCSELNKESLELAQIREFLDWPEPYDLDGGERLVARPGHLYELRLDHVSFRYPGADRDTLHDVDLTIRPGEKIAVVGLNGAGKTTMIKLLCGFLDPTAGRVLLDGRDIREYNRRDYYTLFAAVFQDFSVLDTTVAQNVAQRLDGFDRDRVRECLDEAGLTEKIMSLPGGLDAHIGRRIYEDGVDLSGGQTQRLMLARALYRNAPILLLDEPTAALDPIAENDIYEHYNRMTAGRTSVFISHRLASTRFCDRILFMKDGRISEQGTHESLLAAGGDYARLFNVQSKYYRDDADGTGTTAGTTGAIAEGRQQ
ncbi:ABC transporter ATP-binding protein/permease [Bifidobacterium amazonense]|uniref:ABC transporter ATP-binding protein/permease n=1 Tax=Bifidobacterium amazonense TaxID=2809027 RepID=A0ABS9VUV3_9BIFI|nr:ABC transporter ATP-binding protein [Bifidobacterium amazonense]MCH9275705.1 ABC transporter ATP-binding protein/permease [Bifidobacterium amazonense]MCH9275711.1 ABC transporter ATP-binding protein/permease [Bifidobacterium amazonense]